jgi:hypothetical protein
MFSTNSSQREHHDKINQLSVSNQLHEDVGGNPHENVGLMAESRHRHLIPTSCGGFGFVEHKAENFLIPKSELWRISNWKIIDKVACPV